VHPIDGGGSEVTCRIQAMLRGSLDIAAILASNERFSISRKVA